MKRTEIWNLYNNQVLFMLETRRSSSTRHLSCFDIDQIKRRGAFHPRNSTESGARGTAHSRRFAAKPRRSCGRRKTNRRAAKPGIWAAKLKPTGQRIKPRRAATKQKRTALPNQNGLATEAKEGGRYWVRTSDLFGVNEALYH